MKNDIRQKVIYPLPLIDRIGELAKQIFFLRNQYDEDEYELTVVTFPTSSKPKTNIAVYNMLMRNLNVIHSTNFNGMWACHNQKDFSIVRNEDVLYDFTRLDKLVPRYLEKFQDREPIYRFTLSDADREVGHNLMKKLNIPESAPIVALHVRESGYLQDNFRLCRNANIENYIPAINFLISIGFYIIRLGDTRMKRFVDAPPELIDAPFHPEYTAFFDPYFSAVSKFFISCGSGPSTLAIGFGTPVLKVNNLMEAAEWAGSKKNRLVLSKKDLFTSIGKIPNV